VKPVCSILTRDERLVHDACKIDRGLTGWERDFVESCSQQIAQGAGLTDLQRDKLEEILEERS
jgi:hypothetical protein